MKNFARAVRMALRYRWTVAGTMIFSMLVAAFWGGNIGALYPVIQVAFQGRSLQEWMDEEIKTSQRTVEQHQQTVPRLQAELAVADPADVDSLRRDLGEAQFALQSERRVLATRLRIRPWLDRWLPTDPFRTVVVIVGALMLSTVAKGFCIFANSMCVDRLVQRVTYDLRRQFYHQALRLDLGAFGEERTSGLLSHFHQDISCLSGGVRNLFGSAVREPLKMLACLIGASIISWRLLVFSLLLTPLVGLLIRQLAASLKRANRRVLEEVTQLYGVLTETFNGIQTVQAYTLEQRERQKFRRVSKKCLKKSMRIALYGSLTKPVTEIMGLGMISLALMAGAYLTLNHETHLLGIRLSDRPLDLPSLLIFYGLLIGTTEPARKLSEIFNSLQAGLAAADRLFPLLDRQPTIVNPICARALPETHRRIVFDHVGFHYAPDVPVLSDIDMAVEFGETIAIVGPNGCGKTTLVQLLPRFFDPVHGAIRLDDVDLREVRLRELRQRIGIVAQHSPLFDDTVYNNILAGRLDASQTEVHQAAKRARADRFICGKLADGYQTVVGSGGNRLSGGQRQRVALARAVLRDPEILILDEATSQIDLESEQLIHQALEEFARGRTVFMVTHRMATLALADRVLVMEGGRVLDLGTHDELMKRCPLYERLYSLQFQRSA